jgi:hypothetical protein
MTTPTPRRYSPMKRLNHLEASEVFRQLSLEGWRIELPKVYPVVP